MSELLVDIGDYLRVLVRWLAATQGRRIDPRHLAAQWAGKRGLASLLVASARWRARELATRESLVEEGLVMCHCVAGYWEDCVRRASRSFALESAAGSGAGEVAPEQCERTTALFEDEAIGDLPRYRLA